MIVPNINAFESIIVYLAIWLSVIFIDSIIHFHKTLRLKLEKVIFFSKTTQKID